MSTILMRLDATTKTDATNASDRATYATGRAKLKYFDRKVLYSGRAPIVKGALCTFIHIILNNDRRKKMKVSM